jgi:hypothetical protein
MKQNSVLVIMHEGCYSDQTWNTYWCPVADLEAFMLLSERYTYGYVQYVLDCTEDHFGVPIEGDDIAYSIAREISEIIRQLRASKQTLSQVEFTLAKRVFLERITDPKVKCYPFIDTDLNRNFFDIPPMEVK